MATYVLVHGGEHGGWCYQKVARLLLAEGHEVHAPTHTGLGERAHLLRADIDLDTHITDVASMLVFEDLRDVILVGHSYGGMVITGVADRALDRVGHLVFLDAAIPENGESLVDVSPQMMAMAREQSSLVDGVLCSHLPPELAAIHFGVTDPAEVAWTAERLRPQPWKCYEQPLRLRDEAAVKRIPRTIINCTPTLALRPANNLHRVLEGERVWEIDTGHDVMLTEPAALAGMLLRLA
jgi:pimeloyl-ACP methyl ester carboxylesterase